MKSSRFSSLASITNSNIRNCSSQTSSTSWRKTRSILYFVLVGRDRRARRKFRRTAQRVRPYQFVEFDEQIVEIGHNGDGFAYDNEGPRHRALVPAFSLATRPVTNGEYIAFIEDNGYSRPEFWLSLGWMTVNEQRWNAPLYWTKRDGAWWNFTLSGLRRVDQSEPVTHVSYFEADAYANWAGARLPTEFEWERAALSCPIEGNFVETELFHPVAVVSAVSADKPGKGSIFTKCSATFGNGRAAPTRPIPATALLPARLASTTANSCATNTSCAVVPARHPALISAAPIAISFNRKNAGSSPESDSHAIAQ